MKRMLLEAFLWCQPMVKYYISQKRYCEKYLKIHKPLAILSCHLLNPRWNNLSITDNWEEQGRREETGGEADMKMRKEKMDGYWDFK